jgi:hypothetical protein
MPGPMLCVQAVLAEFAGERSCALIPLPETSLPVTRPAHYTIIAAAAHTQK